MNSRLRPDHGPEIRLADADALPLVTSDEAVLQAVAARFARSRLSAEQLRDVKLLVFVMEMEGGRLGAEGPGGLGRQAPLPGIADWGEQLAAAAGISRARIEAAAARLVDAGVLLPDPATPGRLGFAADVLRPIGVAQFLDWPWVTSRLRGHVPALLIFRAFLDTVRDPGGWTSATYESLARHACYSLGMAQRGVAQLLAAGVLERSTHVGRDPGAGAERPRRARRTPIAPRCPADASRTGRAGCRARPRLGGRDAEQHGGRDRWTRPPRPGRNGDPHGRPAGRCALLPGRARSEDQPTTVVNAPRDAARC